MVRIGEGGNRGTVRGLRYKKQKPRGRSRSAARRYSFLKDGDGGRSRDSFESDKIFAFRYGSKKKPQGKSRSRLAGAGGYVLQNGGRRGTTMGLRNCRERRRANIKFLRNYTGAEVAQEHSVNLSK